MSISLKCFAVRAVAAGLLAGYGVLLAQQAAERPSSYSPVVIKEDFASVMSRMSAAKPAILKRQLALLEERYDLSNRPAKSETISGGKALQEGVRVKLRKDATWGKLAR